MLWVSSSTHASRRAHCARTTRKIVCAASQTQPGDWEDRASTQQPLRAVSGQARWWRRGSDHGANGVVNGCWLWRAGEWFGIATDRSTPHALGVAPPTDSVRED